MEELAQVYARSLFEVACERDRLDLLREQLGQFADTLSAERDLQTFFFSPYFSTEEKKDGLARALSDADETLVNFLDLLIENHRMPVIFRLRRAFDRLWEEENRMLSVQLTSAVPLDPATVEQVGKQIGKHTGKQIDLTTEVNDGIVGGIVLRVGNSILDASIKNRLERLKKEVAQAA